LWPMRLQARRGGTRCWRSSSGKLRLQARPCAGGCILGVSRRAAAVVHGSRGASVKADLAPPHPFQTTIQSARTHPLLCFPLLFRASKTLALGIFVWAHTLSRRGPSSGCTRRSSGRSPSTYPPLASARISIAKSSLGPSLPS
jgi:hypothetical protein